MKRFTFFILFVFTTGLLNAQQIDTTRNYKKIMIVPFEKQMYLCGVQRDLAETSGKTHDEIVRYFRFGLSSVIQDKFLYYYNAVSLIHYSDTIKDLDRTYGSIKYNFKPFVEENEMDKKSSKGALSGLFNKSPQKQKSTEDGQIKSRRVSQQKYAATVISKPQILPYLNQKYKADLFLFINQFDIENDISDPMAFLNNDYMRFLRVHYTLVDYKGNVVDEGLVQTKFPNSVNDIHVIKKEYLPILANLLTEKLPAYQKEQLKNSETNPTEKIKK